MSNSGGIAQDKTKTIRRIKALLRKRLWLARNSALEQAMQKNYRYKDVLEVAWVQFTLSGGWTT